MKKFFVTILKYLALIIGVLSCLMSFIVLPVTLVFLPLGIFLIFMGLKPVEYLDGTIAKRKKEEKELAEKEQKEELNRMIRQLEKEDLSKRAALIDGVNLKSNEFCYIRLNRESNGKSRKLERFELIIQDYLLILELLKA